MGSGREYYALQGQGNFFFSASTGLKAWYKADLIHICCMNKTICNGNQQEGLDPSPRNVITTPVALCNACSSFQASISSLEN